MVKIEMTKILIKYLKSMPCIRFNVHNLKDKPIILENYIGDSIDNYIIVKILIIQ